MSQSAKTIAYLGLGIMGGAMAANLARSGFKVRGWNRSSGKDSAARAQEAGVSLCSSLVDAVRDADVIFSCLGDESDVIAVSCDAGGVIDLARPGALMIDTTTIGPAAAKEIGQRLKTRAIRFLDAPVTGGDVGAREGTLTILVGGEKSDFDDALPQLNVVGKRIFLCGPTGSGQAVKLCNQILCAVNMVAVCEAFKLAETLDVSPQMIVETLSGGAGGSWALSTLGPRIAKGDFGPGFMLRHMLKDLRLVEENRDGVDLPGLDLARELFEEASGKDTQGDGQGTQSMYRVYA